MKLDWFVDITGFRACGKTKIGKILAASFNPLPHIRNVDMSDAIRHHLSIPDSPLGQALKPHEETMHMGGIVPDGQLIFDSCMDYILQMDTKEGRTTKGLILTGGCRAETETACYLALMTEKRIVHVCGTESDMYVGLAWREKDGVRRSDTSSEAKIKRGWHDYTTFTAPHLSVLPSTLCTPVEFGLSMRQKIHSIIDVLPVTGKKRQKLRRRIDSQSHEAWHMIEKLDHPEWFNEDGNLIKDIPARIPRKERLMNFFGVSGNPVTRLATA